VIRTYITTTNFCTQCEVPPDLPYSCTFTEANNYCKHRIAVAIANQKDALKGHSSQPILPKISSLMKQYINCTACTVTAGANRANKNSKLKSAPGLDEQDALCWQ